MPVKLYRNTEKPFCRVTTGIENRNRSNRSTPNRNRTEPNWAHPVFATCVLWMLFCFLFARVGIITCHAHTVDIAARNTTFTCSHIKRPTMSSTSQNSVTLSGVSSHEQRQKFINKFYANLILQACISFLRCFRTPGASIRKIICKQMLEYQPTISQGKQLPPQLVH